MKVKDLLLLCIFLCGFLVPVFSQGTDVPDVSAAELKDISLKRELSLFLVSKNNFDISSDVLKGVDDEIKNTFISASQHLIHSVEYSFTNIDLGLLVAFLSRKPDELPESLPFSTVELTKDRFMEIKQSTIIVIPIISKYIEELEYRDDQKRYKISIQTDFYFISTNEAKIFAKKNISTLGYDKDRDQALSDAMLNIPPLLAYEIGQIKEFSTGMIILGVSGDEVILEAGKSAGIAVGDEFVIQISEVQPNGQVTTRDKALIVITEVTDEVALGITRYVDGVIAVGDSVLNLGRLGLELSVYGRTFIPLTAGDDISVYAGLRLALSKYISTLRPFIAAEFLVYPFATYETWLPLRFFAGVEIRLFFGPLEIAALPAIGIEERIALSSANESEFAGFGFRSAAECSLMISRELKVFLNGGYEYWIGGRNGILAGGGLSIKF